MTRMLALCGLSTLLLCGCTGTQTGKTLFGTPSNNHISTMQLSFPTPPNRALGLQVLTLQVNAYDPWNNLITVGYNNAITLSSSDGTCEVGFAFYQNVASGSATPPPTSLSLTFNSPQAIGVAFDPNCGGPNPVVITASSPGTANAYISF
jgi:hypothetical protein